MRDVKYNNYPDWVNTPPFYGAEADEEEHDDEQDMGELRPEFHRHASSEHGLRWATWLTCRPLGIPKSFRTLLVQVEGKHIVKARMMPDGHGAWPEGYLARLESVLRRFDIYIAHLQGNDLYVSKGSALDDYLEDQE